MARGDDSSYQARPGDVRGARELVNRRAGWLAFLSDLHGRDVRAGEPVGSQLLVNLDGVPFPQAQVSGHPLHLLPDLAVVQVQNHFIWYAFNADHARGEVLGIGGWGVAVRGRRAV
jgi:hypothetical protein